MQRLTENYKVKKVLSWLLLLIMFIQIFPLDIFGGSQNGGLGNTIEANADSNDRRAAWIKLSQGKQTTEIDEIKNIDQESLRVMALFLSNYYIPFSTVLAGTSLEWKKDDGEFDTEGMTQYQTDMIKALKDDLGFDEKAAQYIVGLTVESSLKSCQQIFVKKSDFELAYTQHTKSVYEKGTFLESNSVTKDDKFVPTFDSLDAYFKDDLVKTTSATVGNSSEEMVSVSMSAFLYMLSIGQNETTTEQESYIPPVTSDIVFYWIDGGIAKPVFDTSSADVTSYLMSNSGLDYKNGAMGFFSVTDEYVAEAKITDTQLRMVSEPWMMLYVDWVGDIVCNIGTGAIVILPGCMNPNTFDYITGSITGVSDDASKTDEEKQVEADAGNNKTDTTSTDSGYHPVNLVNAKGIYEVKKEKIRAYNKKTSVGVYKLKAKDKNGNEVKVYTKEEYYAKLGSVPDAAKSAAVDSAKTSGRYKVIKLSDEDKSKAGINTSNDVSLTKVATRAIYVDRTYTFWNYFEGIEFSKSCLAVSSDESAMHSFAYGGTILDNKPISSLTQQEIGALLCGAEAYDSMTQTNDGKIECSSYDLPNDVVLYIIGYDDPNNSTTKSLELHSIVFLHFDNQKLTACKTLYTHTGVTNLNVCKQQSFAGSIYDIPDKCKGGWNGQGMSAGSAQNGETVQWVDGGHGGDYRYTVGQGYNRASYYFSADITNANLELGHYYRIDFDSFEINSLTYKLQYRKDKELSGFFFSADGVEVFIDSGNVNDLTFEVGMDEIHINGYQYKASQSIATLKYARLFYGSDEYEFDDKLVGWTDTRKKAFNKMKDAGGGFKWQDWIRDNYIGFQGLHNWYQTHSTSEIPDDHTTKEVWLDAYSFNALTEICYYDTLEEINEDTELSDLFKTADMIDIIKDADKSTSNTADGVDNWDTSLEAGTLEMAGASDMQRAVTSLNSGSNKKFAPCIFYTYVWEYFNIDATSYNKNTNVINAKLRFDNYPQVTGEIDWNFLTDTTNDEILSFIYYFLHPTKGIGYVATWFKNKVSGILINWHEDIVGSSHSNSSTGMTKYLGFTGYTTIPTLNDIPWVANLLANYNSIIIYLIILMCVIMLCYVLVGSLTIQRGILGVCIFALFAFLPPLAINTVVDATNNVNDTIYSEKFDYWALVQMQQYIIELDNAKDLKEQGNMNAYADYIISNYTSASKADSVGGESETSYSGVRLKWISPKKYNVTANLSKAMDSVDTNATYLKNILLTSVSSQISGETYIDSDSALYLYRDYLDIYRYASCSYNLYTTFNYTNKLTSTANCNIGAYQSVKDNSVVSQWANGATKNTDIGTFTTHSGLPLWAFVLSNAEGSTSFKNYNIAKEPDILPTTSSFAIRRGWLWNTEGYTMSQQGSITSFDTTSVDSEKLIYYNNETTLATSLLLNYTKAYTDVAQHEKDFNDKLADDAEINLGGYDSTNFWGIDAPNYNYDIQNFTGQRESTAVDNAYDTLSYYYYGLYTESPFYFFSFNIQDQLNASKKLGFNSVNYNYDYDNLTTSTGSIKNLFLGENQKYFYNLETTAGSGYGELRDYMNMHDLFYYVIPILRQGTDLAVKFDDYYGLYTYDDCPLHFQSDGTFIYGSELGGTKYSTAEEFMKSSDYTLLNDEAKYKFWHDYNVNTIFNEYSAWIDTMLDCQYAESEKLTINGEKFIVDDPLDPTTYFEVDDKYHIIKGRYMIFSRSEMEYYGLKWSDLTTVEQKIINIQDNVYKETIDLMNYYTLSDETLIQAYAMIQLFEFNKQFSQTSMVREDYVLYPQAYELKAFTYDAYLRLILAGSTGEDLMSDAQDTGITAEDGTTVQTNTSLYEEILKNTSLFFGIVLLVNDFIAVYVLPAFKLFFLVLIFLSSIALIVASSIKLETPVRAFWDSLLAPMLSFAAISIGMAWLVSKFMSEGAQGVVKTSDLIEMGDPTMVICVMVVINVVALILYWKILKKCLKDFTMYAKAIGSSIGGAITGALGGLVATATGGKLGAMYGGYRPNRFNSGGGSNRLGSDTNGQGGSAKSPQQRGRDNDPKSGKNGLGGAAVGGAVGGVAATEAVREAETRKNDQQTSKYNAKASTGANDKLNNPDKYNNKDKTEKGKTSAEKADAMTNSAKAKQTKAQQKKDRTSSDKIQAAKTNAKVNERRGTNGQAKASDLSGMSPAKREAYLRMSQKKAQEQNKSKTVIVAGNGERVDTKMTKAQKTYTQEQLRKQNRSHAQKNGNSSAKKKKANVKKNRQTNRTYNRPKSSGSRPKTSGGSKGHK